MGLTSDHFTLSVCYPEPAAFSRGGTCFSAFPLFRFSARHPERSEESAYFSLLLSSRLPRAEPRGREHPVSLLRAEWWHDGLTTCNPFVCNPLRTLIANHASQNSPYPQFFQSFEHTCTIQRGIWHLTSFQILKVYFKYSDQRRTIRQEIHSSCQPLTAFGAHPAQTRSPCASIHPNNTSGAALPTLRCLPESLSFAR